MAKEYYDRYNQFRIDGKYKNLPFIKMESKGTDKTVVWKINRDRMDKLSQEYYGNPFHGWLIMLANPQYGGLEDNIPDGEIIRVPYPFRDSLQQYIRQVQQYDSLYGIR
jgi:hypothetical protein